MSKQSLTHDNPELSWTRTVNNYNATEHDASPVILEDGSVFHAHLIRWKDDKTATAWLKVTTPDGMTDLWSTMFGDATLYGLKYEAEAYLVWAHRAAIARLERRKQEARDAALVAGATAEMDAVLAGVLAKCAEQVAGPSRVPFQLSLSMVLA